MKIWFWFWLMEKDYTPDEARFYALVIVGLFVFGFCLEYFYGVDRLERDITDYLRDLFKR